jgi:hypothetical protein
MKRRTGIVTSVIGHALLAAVIGGGVYAFKYEKCETRFTKDGGYEYKACPPKPVPAWKQPDMCALLDKEWKHLFAEMQRTGMIGHRPIEHGWFEVTYVGNPIAWRRLNSDRQTAALKAISCEHRKLPKIVTSDGFLIAEFEFTR